jgi:hypothetical protein
MSSLELPKLSCEMIAYGLRGQPRNEAPRCLPMNRLEQKGRPLWMETLGGRKLHVPNRYGSTGQLCKQSRRMNGFGSHVGGLAGIICSYLLFSSVTAWGMERPFVKTEFHNGYFSPESVGAVAFSASGNVGPYRNSHGGGETPSGIMDTDDGEETIHLESSALGYYVATTRLDVPVEIAESVEDQWVTEPDPAVFHVKVIGSEPFTYQWFRNGSSIAGATNGEYRTPPTSAPNDDGSTYSVTVANPFGTAVSQSAPLRVIRLESTFGSRSIVSDLDDVQTLVGVDLDRDGDTDLLIAEAGRHTLSWHRHDGMAIPSYTSITIDDEFTNVSAIAARDLDRDGDIDIVAAATRENRLVWYEHRPDEDPAFHRHAVDVEAVAPTAVVVADLDADGDSDILAAFEGNAPLVYYVNSGARPPTWTPEIVAVDARGVSDVWSEDIDRDGDLDILTVESEANEIAYYENNLDSSAGFVRYLVASGISSVANIHPVDVDGDGDLDVVAAQRVSGAVTYWSNEGGEPVLFRAREIGSLPRSFLIFK